MKNKEALAFFQNMSEKSQDPKSVKLANSSDFSSTDADFVLKYAAKTSNILDLGSGTGLIINKIYDQVGHITAVEPFAPFTKFYVKSNVIEVVNKTFDDYEVDRSDYDLITLFGVMHYFNEKESVEIYKKFYPALKTGGKIIIKNQFGLHKDVVVEGYSEEQKCNYYAEYRLIDKEVSNLMGVGYKNINVVDIYPPECNRWENTHFYAVVGEK